MVRSVVIDVNVFMVICVIIDVNFCNGHQRPQNSIAGNKREVRWRKRRRKITKSGFPFFCHSIFTCTLFGGLLNLHRVHLSAKEWIANPIDFHSLITLRNIGELRALHNVDDPDILQENSVARCLRSGGVANVFIFTFSPVCFVWWVVKGIFVFV